LLDLTLPQRDGKAPLRQIKAMPHGAHIRVVVVTGSQNPRDQADSFALGAEQLS